MNEEDCTLKNVLGRGSVTLNTCNYSNHIGEWFCHDFGSRSASSCLLPQSAPCDHTLTQKPITFELNGNLPSYLHQWHLVSHLLLMPTHRSCAIQTEQNALNVFLVVEYYPFMLMSTFYSKEQVRRMHMNCEYDELDHFTLLLCTAERQTKMTAYYIHVRAGSLKSGFM